MPKNKIDRVILSLKKYIKIYSSISIGVFLFILFFQPFSAVEFDYENRLLFVSGFGVIIFLFMVLIHVFFHSTLNVYNDDEPASSLYYYLLNFILIGLSSVSFVFYMRFVGKVGITFNVVVKTVIICTSPAIVLNLSNKLQQTKLRYSSLLRETRNLQKKYKQFSESYSKQIVELVSENNSDNISVQLSDLLYIKSADNYVEVGYMGVGVFKKKLLRNTLRNIENQLKSYTNFVRTHRTCIVNIQYMEALNKENNTYWLTLSDTQDVIPVSRQHLLVVKEIMQT